MALLALAGPIATMLGASAATASTIGAIGTVAGAAGSMIQANQAKKEAQGLAGQATSATQVNIDQLNEQIKTMAEGNARASAELEKSLTPEVPALRTAANNAIAGGINSPGLNLQQGLLTGMLGQQVGGSAQSPLLQAAIAKAQADLGLGSSLSPEIQNLVTRKGLATAGTVAPGGLGLGRDIVARDLGLTGLQVEQQRLQNAAQLGGMDVAGKQFDVGTAFNNQANMLNLIQLLNQIQGTQFNQNLAAGQYAQGIRQPVVGMDPGSAANIAVGNQNAQAQGLAQQSAIAGKESQGYQQMAGQFLGAGLPTLLSYMNPSASSGIGGQISYSDFLKQYPNSSAAK